MWKDQHPRFLVEVLTAVQRLAREIANATQHALEHADTSVSDKPRGSRGYRHVCTLGNGVQISIRRFNPDRPKDGLQLEINREGIRIRVPRAAPYIPLTPEDNDLSRIASGLAPYVLGVLGGVDEVGHTGPLPAFTDF